MVFHSSIGTTGTCQPEGIFRNENRANLPFLLLIPSHSNRKDSKQYKIIKKMMDRKDTIILVMKWKFHTNTHKEYKYVEIYVMK